MSRVLKSVKDFDNRPESSAFVRSDQVFGNSWRPNFPLQSVTYAVRAQCVALPGEQMDRLSDFAIALGLMTPNSEAPRPVRLLPQDLIHRIAAGEIVDRPSSVLKELLENSVDAGATEIQVEVVDGGLQSLSVRDNGHGFSAEDLKTALQRHATSKITQLSDLEAILSLGFRGEALAATSSVSRLVIQSFRSTEPQGWELHSLGGQKTDLKPIVMSPGTKVVVRELFFNVPARRKFLKSAASELAECWHVLENFGLAHPDVQIRAHAVDLQGELKREAQWKVQSSTDRFMAVKELESVPLFAQTHDGVLGLKKAALWVAAPPVSSNHTRDIHFIVNGRPIFDKRLPYSLRDAMAGLMEVSRFPQALFVMDIDPEWIDVNIHPQKKELRWPSHVSPPGIAFRLLRQALSNATQQNVEAPGVSLKTPQESHMPLSLASNPGSILSLESLVTSGESSSGTGRTTENFPGRPTKLSSGSLEIPSQSLLPPVASSVESQGFRFSELRVVGEVGAAWLVAESHRGLILIDQHAAHERVEYDRWFRHADLFRSRPVLLSERLQVPDDLELQLPFVREALESLGFELEIHPGPELELLAVPEADRRLDWREFFDDLWEQLRADLAPEALVLKLRSQVAASLACHGSVRRGRRLKVEEITELLRGLDGVDWGGLCPHGRPVWKLLSHQWIAEEFHR